VMRSRTTRRACTLRVVLKLDNLVVRGNRRKSNMGIPCMPTLDDESTMHTLPVCSGLHSSSGIREPVDWFHYDLISR